MKSLRYMNLVVVLFFLFEGMAAHAQNISLTVISNQKGAPPEMKKSELKSIFLGEKQRWKNGNKIMIALLKTNTATGKYVCEKVYDMSVNAVKKHWLGLVFGGKADAPAYFNTVEELQAFVSENSGAIGIIDQVPAISGTQIILIDGKKSF